MHDIIKYIDDSIVLSAIVRMTLAMICGGIIGIERGRKRRPAGFRTHMLVCMGAAMTMIISQFLWHRGQTTDLSRLGAQVINGIGFLGAGTIIVTGKQQVKGLTTAAGLWASACMGLAIGAGFYFGGLLVCLFIILSITVFSKLERWLMSNARNINIYIEYHEADDIGRVIELLKSMNININDIEITRMRASEGLYPGAVFSLHLPKKCDHPGLMAKIGDLPSVISVEEV